jgi:hypothetical protein
VPFAYLQTVSIARDVPADGIRRGMQAVILAVYNHGAAYEVEVLDGDETVFVGTVPGDVLTGEQASSDRAFTYDDFIAARAQLIERAYRSSNPEERAQAQEDYIAMLPVRQLSRCPFTEHLLERAIDDVELDGPWWDHDDPARPPSPYMPTLVAFTGAVRLAHVPFTHFLAVPGPELPFVAPGLLLADGVKAVLSSIRIGAHQGYCIAYYAHPPGPPRHVTRLNDWGASYHLVQGPAQLEQRSAPAHEHDWDYDLAPWIEYGSLLWIAPDDDELVLCSTVDDCPYLELPGRLGITRLKRGEASWSGGT